MKCLHCGAELSDDPQRAVRDRRGPDISEVVAYTESDPLGGRTGYYCDPECFAAEVEP